MGGLSQTPNSYGDAFADVYDRWYSDITDKDATATFVAKRTVSGLPILELGVGTGRLLDPLTQAGLDVVGVDASQAMLEICAAAHPGVPLIRADLAALSVGGPIGGALCAFNTLFNLVSFDDQAKLFRHAGQALTDGAPLIIEAISGVGLDQAPAQSAGLSDVDPDRTVISATIVDVTTQTITGQHVEFQPDNTVKKRNWQLRWSSVDQLDQMADGAGLRLTERYQDWSGDPFTSSSEKHISVYTRA